MKFLIFLTCAVTLATPAIAETVNLDQIKISGYVQARYESAEDSTDGVDASGASTNKDSFYVRRARIKVTANPTARTQIVVQPDFVDKVTTKDAYLGYTMGNSPNIATTLLMGQMKWPFGWEVVESSSVRETPERSIVVQQLFPGERDQGIMFSSPLSRRFRWEAGLFNGTGANTRDNNNDKDLVGKLRYKATSKLNVGVSCYVGKTFVPPATPPGLGTNIDKDRFGADFQYYLSKASVKGEWIKGEDGAVDSQGGYLQLAANFGPRYVGVIKYDAFDPNTGAGDDKLTRWHLGAIRLLDDRTRFKLFYEINKEQSVKTDNNVLRAEIISIF